MNLYLLTIIDKRWATNADNISDASLKFWFEYPDLGGANPKIEKITPEELVKLPNDDDIVFF